jgi:hypothetical protein
MTATRFLIRAQSLGATWRRSPHREHCSSRGKVEELAIPAWPHELQAILSIMVLPCVDFGGNEKSPRGLPEGLSFARETAWGETQPPPRCDPSTPPARVYNGQHVP